MAYITHYQIYATISLFPKTTYPPNLRLVSTYAEPKTGYFNYQTLTCIKKQQLLFMISSCTKVLLSRCKCFSWRWKMTLQGSCKRLMFAQGWCMRRKTSIGHSGWWCSLGIEGRSTGERSTICAPNMSWNQEFKGLRYRQFYYSPFLIIRSEFYLLQFPCILPFWSV